MKPMKKVALLHSLCSVGKASITNMLPILSAMGVEVCPIPTILLSTHTGGYGAPARQVVDAAYLKCCADHYMNSGIVFDVIFVGYLGNTQMTEAVLYFASCFPNATLIVDPIMGDHGRLYANLDTSYVSAFLPLCQRADLILPNLTEACLLAEYPYEKVQGMEGVKALCSILHNQGISKILVTSAHFTEDHIHLYLSKNCVGSEQRLPMTKAQFHGTGDVFDAVLLGYLLRGEDVLEASEKAHHFVETCLSESLKTSYEEREGLLLEKCLSYLV